MDLVRFVGVSDNSDNEALVQAALSFLSIRARRGGEAWSTSKIIRWKHITPVTGGVNVKINTKTGFYDLFFPELPGSPICFVKRLETLRSISYPEPGDPVFADRKGNLLKQQQVADYVAKCHRRLGNHNPLKFSAKSCRAGSATASVELKMPEATTKMIGAWKSNAYQRYARVEKHTITSAVSAMVGLQPEVENSCPSSPPKRSKRLRFPNRKFACNDHARGRSRFARSNQLVLTISDIYMR
jgi:hypothetical protein